MPGHQGPGQGYPYWPAVPPGGAGRRVYFGNLSWDVQSADLKVGLGQHGERAVGRGLGKGLWMLWGEGCGERA